jgi:hypothetical protein
MIAYKSLALGIALIAAAAAVPAQAQEKNVGKVGNFTIVEITDNGKFNRCSASMTTPGSGMLRFAFGANRQHYMSIPGVEGSGLKPMDIALDGGSKAYVYKTHAANKSRASAMLDYEMVDRIIAAKKSISVSFAGRLYDWSLAGQKMEAVFQAITNCVGNAMAAGGDVQQVATVKDWTISKQPASDGSALCAAVLITDQEQGVRFVRTRDRFEVGFSGMGSSIDNKPLEVVTFFDKPKPSGELPVQAPMVSDKETGIGWRTVVRESSTARADQFAKAKTFGVAYKFEGKQQILTFPMAASGAAAALQALFACAK